MGSTDLDWSMFFPINYGNKAHNGHKVNYKTHCASRPSFVLCLHSNRSKKIGAVYPSDARESKHLRIMGFETHCLCAVLKPLRTQKCALYMHGKPSNP